MYVLAAAVAFAAVLGAWHYGSGWLAHPRPPAKRGYLALVTLTQPDTGKAVAAALAVRDAAGGAPALYVIPRELLVEGPKGEYVFAGDAMTNGTLREDLQRVVNAKIDADYRLPLTALGDLGQAQTFTLSLPEPVELDVGGTVRSFGDGSVVRASQLPSLFAAGGPTGEDSARMQEALWKAVADAAARRPDHARARAVAAAIGLASPAAADDTLRDALRALTAKGAAVAIIPAVSRVAEGQFAFLPNADEIMAQITRRAPGFRSRYTVLVRNGSGRLGVGRAVATKLAVLDVNLPAPANADTFGYRQTQILAGSEATAVAEDIRAILGRGVVLDGADLPPDTVIVIVGADTKSDPIESKDQL